MWEGHGVPRCAVCREIRMPGDTIRGAMIQGRLAAAVRRRQPEWTGAEAVCLPCLLRCRCEATEALFNHAPGWKQVADPSASTPPDPPVDAHALEEAQRQRTLGEYVADRVAQFGGSWTFVLSYLLVLVAWVIINTHLVLRHPFDPYPFIFLNLILSFIAAIQAPVILMSQNRQDARDRLRAEYEFQINYQAEEEIRELHAKLDHLTTQHQHILDLQRQTTALLLEITNRLP